MKALRLLSIYERLCQGSVIQKKNEGERFLVHTKTIQRDIEDLRMFLVEEYPDEKEAGIIYDRQKGGYRLKRDQHTWLTNEEVLLMAKILLESRACPRTEINQLLSKLILQCEPKEQKRIKKYINNEHFHYIDLQHGTQLKNRLWDINSAVYEHRTVTLEYQRPQNKEVVRRVVEPYGIMFSEYYFYLIAYIKDSNFAFPAVYRLDRIVNYQINDECFTIPDRERFEEGEFRKRVQFMRSGPIIRIRFRFWGQSLEAVLDRLSTARVLEQEGKTAVVEVEVFGTGIKMWLLSQAQFLEVISPDWFRAEMQQTIRDMLSIYEDSGVMKSREGDLIE